MALTSAMASPRWRPRITPDDLYQPDDWMKGDLHFLPLEPPMGSDSPDDLTWVYGQVLGLTGGFRALALPSLGLSWCSHLPCVPHPKEELKDILVRQWEAGELLSFRAQHHLIQNSLGRFELTWERVKAALSILSGRHPARMNLLSIISGTRFKNLLLGLLGPTR